MNKTVIPAPTLVTLPIVESSDVFPVRRIYCVGKNYKKHVAEMGGDPKKSKPVFFTKSRETIVHSGSRIPYPPQTDNLHFEVELVVAMANATEIFGFGVGIDMTRRDIQAIAKEKGGPWDMAKNFDSAAPCSALVRAKTAPDISEANITLKIDGQIKQNSTLDHMIYSVAEIISHLNQSVTLAAGDLIYTGTPEGVGPVIAGETLKGEIDGLPSVDVSYF